MVGKVEGRDCRAALLVDYGLIHTRWVTAFGVWHAHFVQVNNLHFHPAWPLANPFCVCMYRSRAVLPSEHSDLQCTGTSEFVSSGLCRQPLLYVGWTEETKHNFCGAADCKAGRGGREGWGESTTELRVW